jgi:hypothetical protein
MAGIDVPVWAWIAVVAINIIMLIATICLIVYAMAKLFKRRKK